MRTFQCELASPKYRDSEKLEGKDMCLGPSPHDIPQVLDWRQIRQVCRPRRHRSVKGLSDECSRIWSCIILLKDLYRSISVSTVRSDDWLNEFFYTWLSSKFPVMRIICVLLVQKMPAHISKRPPTYRSCSMTYVYLWNIISENSDIYLQYIFLAPSPNIHFGHVFRPVQTFGTFFPLQYL